MKEQLLTTRSVFYAFGPKPYDTWKKPILLQGTVPAPTRPIANAPTTPDRSVTISMTQQIKLACCYQIVRFDVFY